ncbi:choice-of-anchor D domain-containing protein [Thermodesulfobacteriota bacterium]
MKHFLTKRPSYSGPVSAALTAGIHCFSKPLMAVMLVLLMATSAIAGTHTLGTPVDDSSDANVPVTDHLMVTIPTSASKGGNSATLATVRVLGTVEASDVASVSVQYGINPADSAAVTGIDTPIDITITSNAKGGENFIFYISLNASAGNKTFGLVVESISGTTGGGSPIITTTLRNAIGLTTPQEMNVYYQSTPAGDITSGDASPSGAEGTDFGDTQVSSNTDRTFRIENTGDDDLDLTDPSPYVTVSGTDFSLITPYPTTPVAGGTYTEFTVRFTPGSAGSKSGQVTIYNNDSDENPYTFDIAGNGTVPAPEMNVYYQSTPSGDVADGDTTPTAVEGSEFGDSLVSVSVDRTFTIQNTGDLALNLTDASPYVTVTGADFTLITAYPTTPVASGGGTTTFTVRFTPSSAGLKTGSVSIGNDDSDEHPYNFNIQGTGAVPEINVYYQSTPAGDIPDGDSSPSAAEGSEFGNVDVSTNADHTFTIQNTGNADLNLTDASPYVTVTGAGFSLITPYASTPVASGGGTTTFTVRFTPGSLGLKTGTVSVANDDSDENPYNFDIRGTGTAPSPTVVNPLASSVTTSGATLGGEVTVINATSITERGVYWSQTQGFTPPGEGTKISETAGSWPAEPFSAAPLTGLSSGTIYYFQAFAVNDIGGQGYSAEASFYTEPSPQPANLQFSTVEYDKMTIGWDAGGGDGAIVVVKEGSAVEVGVYDPIDETEHTYNNDFLSATDLGNGNKVVYRGPANQFTLTGLTGDVTYHVAVYEYAGAGSLINYQQDAPLQGSKPTTSAPTGHNAVHSIQCDQCHAMHTGEDLVARDAAQESICKTCHNATDMAGSESKWNVGMHEITVVDTRTVDCGSCHEIHNFYDFNTVDTHAGGVTAENQYRIRQDTSKYVAGALEPALFQFDTSVNTNHFAFSDDLSVPAQQTGAPFNGICQTCHTSTSLQWHTNADQATEAKPHNHHKGPAPDNPNCMACHSHAAGFPRPSCYSCHSASQDNGDNLPADPPGPAGRRPVWGEFALNSHHAATAVEEADCLVCHDQTTHMDGYVVLKNADTGALITESTSGGFRKVNLTQTDIDQLNTFCISCHDADGATQEASPSDPFGDSSAGAPEMSLHSNVDFATDRVEAEFTVGCVQCHEGHGSLNLSIIDDESVLIQPGSTTGPVVFLSATGENSGDEYLGGADPSEVDDVCVTCHIGTTVNHDGGDHTASVQATDERDKSCKTCHPHGSSGTTFKGFMPPAGGAATCDTCHAEGGSGVGDTQKNDLRAIFGTGGDLNRVSKHPSLTDNDCKVCHLEPDSVHDDGKIDLRMADGGTYVYNYSFDPVAMQNNICFPCHDGDGASATWTSGDGSGPLQPWSGSTRDAPNSYDQFDTINDTYHPVRGGTGTPSVGITAITMVSPWDVNLGTQTMTCFDCHDTNAHASDYPRFIPVEDPNNPGNYYGIDFDWYQAQDGTMTKSTTPPTPPESLSAPMDNYQSRIDVFCMKCHEPEVYVYDGANNGGLYDSNTSVFEFHGGAQSGHGGIGSSNKIGCMGCHGGFIDATDGNNPTNGAERGSIHGKLFDWETDGGLDFAGGDWYGTSTVENFMMGGWNSGWASDSVSTDGQCSGGGCNHGSISRGGSKTYVVP